MVASGKDTETPVCFLKIPYSNCKTTNPKAEVMSYLTSIKTNKKLILKIAFAALFILLGIYFIKHEKAELVQVKIVLLHADKWLVVLGLSLVFFFTVVQGWMYLYSFRAVQKNISLFSGILVYLKRNFISVFIPAGMVTNIFFFNKGIEEKYGIDKSYSYYASTIFSICSIASSILIAIPTLFVLFLKGGINDDILVGISIILIIIGMLVYLIVSLKNKGSIFRFLEKKTPEFAATLNVLYTYPIKRMEVVKVLLLSCVIEIIGVAHLYIAMVALGLTPSIMVALIGYTLVLIILMSSPLLRGIGIIEVSLTYALTFFGFSIVNALSVAFLFRFFEFWSVLFLGLIAFVARRDSLLFRVFPALLLFILGIVNIISAITPALPQRLIQLQQMIPIFAIQASNWFILFSGLFMLMVAVYLIRGLRSAWLVAIALSSFSLIAHLAKGIDWEEATVALITLIFLLVTRKQYIFKQLAPIKRQVWFPAIVAYCCILIFGTVGFYFLETKHFNADFTLWESFQEAITASFLLNVDLIPVTSFGKSFLLGLHIMGLLTWIFWVYLFLRPYIFKLDLPLIEENKLAKQLVKKYGNSGLDYFKTYEDKQFWFNAEKTGFISFKVVYDYALVLENPVAETLEIQKRIIVAFEDDCRRNGLRVAYYRIPETSLPLYRSLGKRMLPIGKEAVVNLADFTLEGGEKKALRNAINKLTKLGYVFKKYESPQKEGFLQQLKAVSNEWLEETKLKEIVFSQGVFSEKELKNQTILTIENIEGKIEGFVNLIPDYVKGEANFDLMRKTATAPRGTMDFLLVNMFEELKNRGYDSCNLGMVPLSGIDEPQNLQERALQTAYEKIKRFSHYKSLYQFKEKFSPRWTMMYLVFDDLYDLILLPSVMYKAIK